MVLGQTLSTLLHHLADSLRGHSDTAPLAAGYLDKLVQKDLVVLIDRNVLLISQEILRLLSLIPISLQLHCNLVSLLDGLIISLDQAHFFRVCIHFSVIICNHSVSKVYSKFIS